VSEVQVDDADADDDDDDAADAAAADDAATPADNDGEEEAEEENADNDNDRNDGYHLSKQRHVDRTYQERKAAPALTYRQQQDFSVVPRLTISASEVRARNQLEALVQHSRHSRTIASEVGSSSGNNSNSNNDSNNNINNNNDSNNINNDKNNNNKRGKGNKFGLPPSWFDHKLVEMFCTEIDDNGEKQLTAAVIDSPILWVKFRAELYPHVT
jgi:hypothetical protein